MANRQMTVEQLVTEKHTRLLRRGFHSWSELQYGKMPALGDYRWTADLILSTWMQAETGRPPANGLEYRVGNSGGGFDVLDFRFLPKDQWLSDGAAISLSIPLNCRPYDRRIEIPIPWYGGGMSYGSISEQVMLSRAQAAQTWNTFTSTGEGGYPESLLSYKDHVITQVATGMFGVREETIQCAPIIEFKYAQGAKPGLGGHLLGDKVTATVATMRESLPWVSLFSPFPFHSVYSVEDHKKHVDWIKTINPEALVSVKVSTPTDIDMVAVGSYYAGAHIIHIDGSYGGTGAAPEIAKKTIAMPIEFAIPRVHRYLLQEGIRGEVVIMASGGIRTAYDIAKVVALGADGVDPGHLRAGGSRVHPLWQLRARSRLPVWPDYHRSGTLAASRVRLGRRAARQPVSVLPAPTLPDTLRRLGLSSIRDLVGRTDLLLYRGQSGAA